MFKTLLIIMLTVASPFYQHYIQYCPKSFINNLNFYIYLIINYLYFY